MCVLNLAWKRFTGNEGLKIALLLGAVIAAITSVVWYLLAQTLGERSADAARETLVDLAPYYTDRPNGSGPTPGFISGPVELVARLGGVRKFGGVSFSIKGIIRLRNQSAEDHPAAVNGIRIQKHVHLLNILHGTCFWVSDGVPIAAIVLRYSDGETRTLFVRYGDHVRDWFQSAIEPPPADGSQIAWTTQNPISHSPTDKLRIYQSRFANPRPTSRIESLDYVSTLAPCSPFLLALTVE